MSQIQPSERADLPDHASEHDERMIAIDRVGIRGLRYPISVLDKDHRSQHTVATLGLFVGLPAQYKGTHMSRFVEVLNSVRGELTIRNLPSILHQIQQRLEASDAYIEAEFPYFIEKEAPVSKARSLMEYPCRFSASAKHEHHQFQLTVGVPVKSLCPCSKAISERGAHNQRSLVEVTIESGSFVWIEDIVDAVERCASSPVYALLKREDEKFVTEAAYDNPKFVEDLVRDVLLRVKGLDSVTYAKVTAENFESIHNHEAFAEIEWTAMASRDDDLTPDTNIRPLASVEYRFGKWLKQQRAERKLSQSDLASRLSITPSFLSRIESDARQPSNDLLANLSVVLGLPMQILQLKAGVIPAELMRSIQQNPERLLTLYAAQ